MLTIKLLHSEILSALARNGHGAKILIADSNFPVSSCTSPSCAKVFLNLSPGVVNVTDVIPAVTSCIVVESVLGMASTDGSKQPIHEDVEQKLNIQAVINYEKRFEFYEHTKSTDVCLAVVTGERRRFANLLLTVGCLKFTE